MIRASPNPKPCAQTRQPLDPAHPSPYFIIHTPSKHSYLAIQVKEEGIKRQVRPAREVAADQHGSRSIGGRGGQVREGSSTSALLQKGAMVVEGPSSSSSGEPRGGSGHGGGGDRGGGGDPSSSEAQQGPSAAPEPPPSRRRRRGFGALHGRQRLGWVRDQGKGDGGGGHDGSETAGRGAVAHPGGAGCVSGRLAREDHGLHSGIVPAKCDM